MRLLPLSHDVVLLVLEAENLPKQQRPCVLVLMWTKGSQMIGGIFLAELDAVGCLGYILVQTARN